MLPRNSADDRAKAAVRMCFEERTSSNGGFLGNLVE